MPHMTTSEGGFEIGFCTTHQAMVRSCGAETNPFVVTFQPLGSKAPCTPVIRAVPNTQNEWVAVVDLDPQSEESSWAVTHADMLFYLSCNGFSWDARRLTAHIHQTLGLALKMFESHALVSPVELQRLLVRSFAVWLQQKKTPRPWKEGTAHHTAIQTLIQLHRSLRRPAIQSQRRQSVPKWQSTTETIRQFQRLALEAFQHLQHGNNAPRELLERVDFQRMTTTLTDELQGEPESRLLKDLDDVRIELQRLTEQPQRAAEASAENRKKRSADDKARAIQLMEEECLRLQQSPVGATRKRLLNHVQESIDVPSRTVERWFKRGEIAALIDRVGKRPPEKQG